MEALDLPFLPRFERLAQIVEYLLAVGKERRINICIDECQGLNACEPSFRQELLSAWDRNRKSSKTVLVLVKSGTAAMEARSEDPDRPLDGSVDRFIALKPFPLRVEAEILDDYAPNAANDDLLALHVLTGGVVWLIEDLMERGAVDLSRMADAVFRSGSKFIMDAESHLTNEFHGEASGSRTILRALAFGKTKREDLQEELGSVSVSGFLSRLEKSCRLIAPHRPVLSPNYRQTIAGFAMGLEIVISRGGLLS
ncbi:hypothetical protein [uncultured Sutterella sp.]|uniref:AAA family ATPase n=1 Tax=uncultured Sutterella sp. TaxID=286133 RepID=UPI00260FA82F|nr:hypothetical protein [uncultured Sutterella sp.]